MIRRRSSTVHSGTRREIGSAGDPPELWTSAIAVFRPDRTAGSPSTYIPAGTALDARRMAEGSFTRQVIPTRRTTGAKAPLSTLLFGSRTSRPRNELFIRGVRRPRGVDQSGRPRGRGVQRQAL